MRAGRDQMGVQDRLNDVLQPRALPHDLVAARHLAAERLCRLVGDPDLRQKAAGIELGQYPGIDLIGLDLGMRNKPDLLRIGDNYPTDVRSDYRGNRSRIAGGFDDDNVALGQLLGKFLQRLATHDDTPQTAELAVFPGHRLGKGAVNIQSNDPHFPYSVLDRSNGSSRATRDLLIRARSASGPVARGGHVTSSGSQPRVCRRPARTFVLPTPRVPDGLTIARFPKEAADTRAPKSSCRITASASASTAPSSTSSTGSPSARRSTRRSTSCRPTSTPGSSTTTSGDPIRAAGASAKPRCRPSLTQSHSRRRNSWPLDHRRQLHWLNQPTASVRPTLDYYILAKGADYQ